mmetsp:Transcript_20608/g.30984  ORF Transcript_20608/g.30984 Transcript_20608/m.30984 type:complete len:125 (+) Transcript_20608:165-539(+)
MKIYRWILVGAAVPSGVFSFIPTTPVAPPKTSLFSVMSDMDIMCLSNAADLCSYYDECDIEEREAFLNRFEEQTELMAERMATMQSLVRHLKTGDHLHVEDEEVAKLKQKILLSAGWFEEHLSP